MGLDPALRQQLLDTVRGRGVLRAAHLIEEVHGADRLMRLHQGTVRFEGSIPTFMAQAEVLRQLGCHHQRMPDKGPDARFKIALQVVGIPGLAGMLAMIFHKGFPDISLLWQLHAGGDFWIALARYFFRNLAG